ncbi:hypothetical protein FACHB389_21960 [Nostoc calcicola FACHB-389]|nr:hypothetical protein [Nostoc calcicola FACHB-3891]OKH31217.1 hypothetical protein FACHB389_21960 [Nostoc calcicola FACHB-389]
MVEPKDSGQITKGKIDEAITALKDIKPKERDSLSERVAIRKMRRYIEKLTSDKYGYTYDEVSEMLLGLGINLSGSRIKYLLGEVKKNTRRHKTKNQGASPSTNEQIKVEIQLEPIETASEVQSSPLTNTKSKIKNAKSIEASTEP